MKKENLLVQALIEGAGISLLDAVILIRGILDFKPDDNNPISSIQFCRKVIDCGLRHYKNKDATISLIEGFKLYIESKTDLRPSSLHDIKTLGKRLFRIMPEMKARNFSDISYTECEHWLSAAFSTPSQFNKGRTMLHGFFEFILRHGWCEKNPVKFIKRRKVIENEIFPLSIGKVQKLLTISQKPQNRICSAAVAILVLAGIRPNEVCRLKWRDIDLCEHIITVRSKCSKTGGVRQVEICPSLRRILIKSRKSPETTICPPNWIRHWKQIRDESGFKGLWVQDVLRHTYASYYAKFYRNLSQLQLNMGHRDLYLLRTRYINMSGISKSAAKAFFN